jgi:hypothetical protein
VIKRTCNRSANKSNHPIQNPLFSSRVTPYTWQYVCTDGWMNAWTVGPSYSHSVIKNLSALLPKTETLKMSPIKENDAFLRNVSDEIKFRSFMQTTSINKTVHAVPSFTLSRSPYTECRFCRSRRYPSGGFHYCSVYCTLTNNGLPRNNRIHYNVNVVKVNRIREKYV